LYSLARDTVPDLTCLSDLAGGLKGSLERVMGLHLHLYYRSAFHDSVPEPLIRMRLDADWFVRFAYYKRKPDNMICADMSGSVSAVRALKFAR
jgi:hypothetical protein